MKFTIGGREREIIAKGLLLTAILGVGLSFFIPYWKLRVIAPQYPQGLELVVYLNHVEGDVREINGLNHYIGMRSLNEGAKLERKFALPGLIAVALCLFSVLFFRGKWSSVLILPALVLPIIFALDLYWWLWDFGLHLDPHAPLSSSVKPFMPPILGHGQIAQFKATANFSWGFLLSFITAAFSALVLVFRFWKDPVSNDKTRTVLYTVIFLFLWIATSPSLFAETIVVGQNSSVLTIQEALKKASTGDQILVHSGSYQGPLVIDKSVKLIGENWPVIDGYGKGTVVHISAPNVLFQGFVVRNSGDVLSKDDTGILVTAPHVTIVNNRLQGVLFGIYLRQAPFSRIENNLFVGKSLLPARRGDLIRLWYSDDTQIIGNETQLGRDGVLWFSKRLIIRNNILRNGRYGLHFMYCQDAVVEDNVMSGNSVGAYLMYSAHLKLSRNRISDNRGTSGYGIGLKDMEGAEITENLIANNKVGLFFDAASGDFHGNLIAYNDVGIEAFASASNNQFKNNSFIENNEHVTVDGMNESDSTNRWHGNFWSDYQGYDRNKDGFGDVPYQSMELFERLAIRYPILRLFLMSPSGQALDFASSAFPIFAPKPKFEDRSPLMKPVLPPVPKGTQGFSWLWMIVSSVLLVPPINLSMGTARKRRLEYNADTTRRGKQVNFKSASQAQDSTVVIRISNLRKHFGKTKALDGVSFDVKKGEAVALWGPNGAGKTTLLRSLLGILPSEGAQNILGLDVHSHGKEVRRNVGYVPQEIRLHADQSILETIEFYAKLRGVALNEAERLIEDWGLGHMKSLHVHALSGGMKQKLGLVIALLSNPPLLFLDEPTSNLDVYARNEFYTYLERLKEQGKTMVFCSHRFSEVLKLADRVIVLKAGKKIVEGRPEEIKDFLTGDSVLCLTVRKEDSGTACALMARQGIHVKQNGALLWIQTPSGQKIEPLRLLLDAGIQVFDFELENEPTSPFVRKEENR